MAHSVRLWLETEPESLMDREFDIRVVLQTVQMPGVCSYIYGTVYYKEASKSFEKSRALSRLWASFCHDIAMIVQKAT